MVPDAPPPTPTFNPSPLPTDSPLPIQLALHHGRTPSGRIHRALCLSVVVVLIITGGCQTEDAAPETPPRPVRYEQVFSISSEQGRTFSGVTQAGSQVQVAFRVGGSVEAVGVQVGQQVRRAQQLARLDATDYLIQERQAEAALAQANAQLRNAEATYERTQQLYTNRGASQSDLDAARAQFTSAQAQVRSAEAQLRAAERQVGFTRLQAPIAGSVAEVRIEVGEQVSPGQPVVTISGTGQPEVVVPVPEGLIGRVRAGSAARVLLSATGEEEYEATITEVGVAPTGGATTFPVTVQLTENSSQIRPGMAADVTLSVNTQSPGEASSPAPDRVVVPMQSVGEDRDGRFVFVLDQRSDDRALALRRRVETGGFQGDAIEILSGVNSGDLVVTAGVSSITDSQEVALLEPPRLPADSVRALRNRNQE